MIRRTPVILCGTAYLFVYIWYNKNHCIRIIERSLGMKYRFMLLLTALIWGCAFVAQRTIADIMGPFSFNALRFFVSSIALIPLVFLLNHDTSTAQKQHMKKPSFFLICTAIGFFLFAGSAFQQIGLIYTTAGKASFITSLYIIAVPLLGLFLKNALRMSHLIGCLIAVIGLYLLTFHDTGTAVNMGDIFELIGVFFWSCHILCIGRFASDFPGVILSFGQFIACTFFNVMAMLICGETLTWPMITASAIAILYCGIFSSSVGYTLQIIAQKHVPPTETSLLCSFEMIFGALAGILLLGEWMSLREGIGCVFMAVGIFAAQLPSRELIHFSKSC